MPKMINVEFVTDIMCPYCMIGKKRLREAAKIAGVDVRFKFTPFLLNPALPDEGISLAQYYANQYGPSRYPAMELPRLQELEPSIRWKVYEPSDTPNVGKTMHAHRLVAWAGRRFGAEAQELVADELDRLYFVEAKLLSSFDNLVLAAERANLDVSDSEVLAYLNSEEDRTEILEQDQIVKTMKNIHGVPHMVAQVDSDSPSFKLQLPLASPEQMAQVLGALLAMSDPKSGTPKGMKVQLDGLQSNTELNGHIGTVQNEGSGRVNVAIGNRVVGIKKENAILMLR